MKRIAVVAIAVALAGCGPEPTGWKMVDPWLKALDNEVWTINRSL